MSAGAWAAINIDHLVVHEREIWKSCVAADGQMESECGTGLLSEVICCQEAIASRSMKNSEADA